MPLHWLKLTQRGFNQSQLIANELATRLANCNVRNDICYRSRYHRDQHLRSRQQRLHLTADIFTAQHQSDMNDTRVALIDDVMTTGATAMAATECLLGIGIKSVDIWCIARTGWHNSPR